MNLRLHEEITAKNFSPDPSVNQNGSKTLRIQLRKTNMVCHQKRTRHSTLANRTANPDSKAYIYVPTGGSTIKKTAKNLAPSRGQNSAGQKLTQEKNQKSQFQILATTCNQPFPSRERQNQDDFNEKIEETRMPSTSAV
jgi:hypothetical protein